MILPKTNQKSYGVIHTENYFSFTGFCKKVNSDEIQTVDIYLDDVLIDTILADKKLQKIEDIYDIEGFGFTYNLSNEFIGNKKSISFKNHQTKENLQNSPYTLIDKNNANFNEIKFMYSLSQFIDIEKLKDIYCQNSIGFLAKPENIENKEFVAYIKDLANKLPQLTFKPICFNKKEKDSIKLLFEKEIRNHRFKIIEPINIKDLIAEINLFCENFSTTTKESNHKLFLYLMKNHLHIYPYGFHSELYSQKLTPVEIKFFNKIFEELNINYPLNTQINRGKFKFFDIISIANNYVQFAKMILTLKNNND